MRYCGSAIEVAKGALSFWVITRVENDRKVMHGISCGYQKMYM
jgi:hypothetical protein